MRIGWDLDGVLYDFTTSLAEYIESAGHRPPGSLSRIPTCWEYWTTDWDMSREEYKEHFQAGIDAGVVFRTGKPFPGAVEAVRRLRGSGHSIHIVTARHPGGQSEKSTVAWLAEEDIPYDSLTFSADKTVIDCDFFIDDSPLNVDALRASGVRAFLLASPPGAGQPRAEQLGHPCLIDSFEVFEKAISAETSRRLEGAPLDAVDCEPFSLLTREVPAPTHLVDTGAPSTAPCGRWMPLARSRCVLGRLHAGNCRSRRSLTGAPRA